MPGTDLHTDEVARFDADVEHGDDVRVSEARAQLRFAAEAPHELVILVGPLRIQQVDAAADDRRPARQRNEDHGRPAGASRMTIDPRGRELSRGLRLVELVDVELQAVDRAAPVRERRRALAGRAGGWRSPIAQHAARSRKPRDDGSHRLAAC
jgi:hypothetical protein